LLLLAGCPQRENSNKAARQQEAGEKKTYWGGVLRGGKNTKNKNTRGTGKTLKKVLPKALLVNRIDQQEKSPEQLIQFRLI
jgi:hypothetical protein